MGVRESQIVWSGIQSLDQPSRCLGGSQTRGLLLKLDTTFGSKLKMGRQDIEASKPRLTPEISH